MGELNTAVKNLSWYSSLGFQQPPRLPTTINLIGFMESTKDLTLQKPGQPFFKWSWKPRGWVSESLGFPCRRPGAKHRLIN